MRAVPWIIALLVLGGCGGNSKSSNPPPIPGDLYLVSVQPAQGTLLGGTRLTIRGGGFSAGIRGVAIGGRAATDISVSSDTVLNCTSPAADGPGPADVTVATSVDTATAAGLYRAALARDPQLASAQQALKRIEAGEPAP